jgi:hypothetical protein
MIKLSLFVFFEALLISLLVVYFTEFLGLHLVAEAGGHIV